MRADIGEEAQPEALGGGTAPQEGDSPHCWPPQIEIELGMKCWYHSVFACPILRQQTSDSNPPIKLICGHVISRDALNKLINGGRSKFLGFSPH